MTFKRTVAFLVLLTASASPLSGCGGGGKTEVSANTTTKGRELQDLEDARAKGLLSEKEYKEQRKKILERE
jgi:hypothetical protein